MPRIIILAVLFGRLLALEGDFRDVNPNIDMSLFIENAKAAMQVRASSRLSEQAFIAGSKQPGVMILDARSKELYDKLHIKGAINLSFSDISYATLAALLPDKKQTILIYCNNNFRNAPVAFPSKLAALSLNVPTYVALYSNGYVNVYELGPLLDIHKTAIEFVGTKE
jgi:rhodanese-related sulfurtransferase